MITKEMLSAFGNWFHVSNEIVKLAKTYQWVNNDEMRAMLLAYDKAVNAAGDAIFNSKGQNEEFNVP